MTSYAAAFRFDHPAEKVWPFVNWEGAERLAGRAYFHKMEFETRLPVPGARRTLHVKGSPPIIVRLIEYNEFDRFYRYRLEDAGPLAIADYTGYVRVLPAGENACILSFSCDCVPLNVSPEAFAEQWREGEGALARIVHDLLEEDVP